MDYMSFIRPFLPRFGEIEGLSEDEIIVLQDRYEVELPEAYKQYMMIFGKKSGEFLPGVVLRMGQLERIHESYQRDLAIYTSHIPIPFEVNWYFFGIEQENYFYFECDGNPDPKVWMMSAPDSVEVVYNSFTDLLKEELRLDWEVKI